MSVWKNQIYGLVIGFVFGGAFADHIELIGMGVLAITAIQILFRKNLMNGPLWGFIGGILVGYALRTSLHSS